MLTEETQTQCWVKPDGQIEVLTKTLILRDGKAISSSNHRHVVDVGQDTANEDTLVRDVALAVHTPARIAKRQGHKEEMERGPELQPTPQTT
jgi:hypothetical protein